MKYRVKFAVWLPIISLLVAMTVFPCSVKAGDAIPPHLIQTVSDKDIYEGLLQLGLLECSAQDEADCKNAYEMVKDCVVRINMGNAYGSGVIWEMTPEQIVIVTNKHVLEFWDEKVSDIHFSQGYFAKAEILGVSKEHDIGFLTIDNEELGYDSLEKLRYVRKDMKAYQELQSGNEVFYVGAQEGETEGFFQGSIGDMQKYIEEFEDYMIYGYGYARKGMSGGGTFDAKGNFIGMISGGTVESETASVPLTSILEAYEEVQP